MMGTDTHMRTSQESGHILPGVINHLAVQSEHKPASDSKLSKNIGATTKTQFRRGCREGEGVDRRVRIYI